MVRIRVLVADGQGLMCAGLCSLLENQPDMEVAGQATNGNEAVDRAVQTLPDVVLMDVSMPVFGGLEAVTRIKREAPSVHVLALATQDNQQFFSGMLAAGASGCVLKEAYAEELLAAIRAIHRGEAFLSPSIARFIVNHYPRAIQEKDGYDFLTRREKQILNMVADGKSNREMAEALILSIKTVEKHRSSMMRKLKLRNATDLIRYALRVGLIPMEE